MEPCPSVPNLFEYPNNADAMVPSVTAMFSHDKNVLSLAKNVFGSTFGILGPIFI
eukprot:CAMPEP_0198236930 /NCGR_PEP_ID=MMETSP1446-20131203/2814_1 /TAXON_ID=1461542 ORGANISM="Unidentified sp, Strain CCMP2111" /NCGR_SAMPLE_ID=MMETSP1446 /ASSEMBLY_ACC=CAM_ASM_001112 /LENGTH=54 /DNA_ID=CAMNT_0043918907 /DNA_START=498 /DNA_END=662 /DNA_ORIENTATION=+